MTIKHLYFRLLLLQILLTSVFSGSIAQGIVPGSDLKAILNYDEGYVPKELLSGRTAVFISTTSTDKRWDVRGDWKAIAEEVHPYIKKLGIDPVMYYYYQDVFAGPDVEKKVVLEMVKREIVNIIFIGQDNQSIPYKSVVVISEFNKKLSLVARGQKAWKMETSEFKNLFRSLARVIDRNNLQLENFLILDVPEFLENNDIIEGNKYKRYNSDLRIDNLAIPRFLDQSVPESSEDAAMKQTIEEDNKKNLQRNSQIEQIMGSYPFKYKIVEYNYDEEALGKQGYQYVLMKLETSARVIQDLLGYEAKKGEKLSIMKRDSSGNITMQPIPSDARVCKYYIRHLNSGDIYLGSHWDAAENWEEALRNHIEILVSELGGGNN